MKTKHFSEDTCSNDSSSFIMRCYQQNLCCIVTMCTDCTEYTASIEGHLLVTELTLEYHCQSVAFCWFSINAILYEAS